MRGLLDVIAGPPGACGMAGSLPAEGTLRQVFRVLRNTETLVRVVR